MSLGSQSHSKMTMDEPSNIGETYKQLNEAEQQAAKLEKMLDDLDAKMDSILKDAETLKSETQEKKSD